MKIVSTGSIYDIFPDDLKCYDTIPAGYYIIRFNTNRGFFLEKYSEFSITDDKIYGVHMAKVQKVLDAFDVFKRNLGVILSGDKGIGKSLFARILGKMAVKNGMPVIIVENNYDDIGSFIDRIDQEVMVLFDEFDKIFARRQDDKGDQQSALLSLFDGVSSGKKLFVLTCNELRGLNDFLVNRPGRFHYHFRFDYPDVDDVREFLSDKVDYEYQGEIDNVVKFSKRISLNYDCLRAIAFELNTGLSFSEAIKDLNILNVDTESYIVKVSFNDGTVLTNNDFQMNTFSNRGVCCTLHDNGRRYSGEILFVPNDIKYDTDEGLLYIDVDKAELDYDTYDESDEDKKNELIRRGLAKIIIIRKANKNLYYAV